MSQGISNAGALYKRLLSYGKPFWVVFVIAIIANISYSGVDASLTYMLKPLLDKGFIARDASFLQTVPYIIAGLFIARMVANFVSNYAMEWVGRNVIMAFRRQMFANLLRLPASFYDKNSSGELLSKMIYDSSQVANACTDALTTLAQSGFLVLGLVAVMFTISWQLTMIFVVTAPMIAILVKLASRRMRRLNLNVQNTMGSITHVAEESIENYKVVRTFGGSDYENNKFLKVTNNNRVQELKVIITKSLSGSGVQAMGVMALTIMILLATSSMSHTKLTAGEFSALMTAMLSLLRPMKNLTTVNAKIQRGLAGAFSIFTLLDEPVEKDTGTQTLARAQGAITFNQVNFNYDNAADKRVLHNINLKVQPGEVVALVGRSGSGKSTLVSLLTRFYDYTEGEILLDGINIKEFTLNNLREQFALVNQQVSLFNDTIYNNIAYGQFEQCTEAQVKQAAIAAHAMEFIDELPDGLHTLIGENGVLLSGGQRQRLAIARAVLKDSPILILDEATSALDTESERHIQQALDSVMRERTTIVIAHRLSTIENADKIVVMDNGYIVEQGTHQELLQHNGHYTKLHRLQFSDHVSMS